MKKITFYYVRHGQTLFNILGRLQGWCDSPLTEKGIADAERASAALADIPFTAACSSSSPRASRTAEIILKHHDVPLKTYDDLREFDYGMLDGEKTAAIPLEDLLTRRRIGSWADVGGEDSVMICTRIRKLFESLAGQLSDNDQVLIVSHGTYAMFLMKEMLGIDLDEYRRQCSDSEQTLFPNGGIMKFAYENGTWNVLRMPCIPELFEG
jgi:broad specificity phosphatase PhoE